MCRSKPLTECVRICKSVHSDTDKEAVLLCQTFTLDHRQLLEFRQDFCKAFPAEGNINAGYN